MCISCIELRSVRKVELSKQINPLKYDILCSWCGALIRSSNIELPEQMCLICHARMLNDYFQRVKKKPQITRVNSDKKGLYPRSPA